MIQEWVCSRCGFGGQVEYEEHAEVWEFMTALKDDHARLSPDCDTDLYITLSDPLHAAPTSHSASRLRAADVVVGTRIAHRATVASAGVYAVTKCERVWTGMGERIRITFAVTSRNGAAFESSVLVGVDDEVEIEEGERE